MKQSFNILNEAVANAAIEEGKKLNLTPSLEKTEDGFEISYASYMQEPEETEKEAKSEYMTYADMENYHKSMSYEMKFMREDIAYMYKGLAEHKKGHLPAINDAGKMKEALETLGLGDSYDVQKPTISVSYD